MSSSKHPRKKRPLNPTIDLHTTPRLSRVKVNWACPICGNVTSSTIPAKIQVTPEGKYHISGCVSCAYGYKLKVVPGINDFATKHPYLEKHWKHISNAIICDPTSISEKSSKKVWWSCDRNPKHKFMMTVRDRVMYEHRNKIACPYCKGLRQKMIHFM